MSLVQWVSKAQSQARYWMGQSCISRRYYNGPLRCWNGLPNFWSEGIIGNEGTAGISLHCILMFRLGGSSSIISFAVNVLFKTEFLDSNVLLWRAPINLMRRSTEAVAVLRKFMKILPFCEVSNFCLEFDVVQNSKSVWQREIRCIFKDLLC